MKAQSSAWSRMFGYLLISSLALSSTASAMTGGKEGTNGPDAPAFVKLERNQPSYVGTVIDDGTKLRVKDISFTGNIKLGGIRSETSDSSITLSLDQILKLEIVNTIYTSKKFPNQEFILVNVVPKRKTKAGTEMTMALLIPRNVQISAKDVDTDIEHAWWLREISKLIIDDPQPLIKREVD